MRRHISKDKEIPISQKVKKMFRYSPSYEAQKCYSKLPLRYSYTSNTTKINSMRQDDMHCEYSSVKQKNIQTYECNDTSSWIAKLVSGIQDSDDENKNLHKLSEIQNQSLNDLPEDSQDYPDNQFLAHKTYHLFNSTTDEKTQKQPQFVKQVPIANPIKKSIKEALIQIELNEIKQGMKVPPVTRANSSKKQKQNHKVSKNNSKYNSDDKNIQQKSSFNEETVKSPFKQKFSSKKYPVKSVRNSLNSNKPKSQAKRKLKTLEKFVEKSIQVEDMNVTYTEDFKKVKGKTFESQSQSDQSLYVQTCKNSVVNSGTKKQGPAKKKDEAQDFKTRKNSLINKEDLSECKEQFNMVEEYSRNLNMKNLFSEENQAVQKPSAEEETVIKTVEGGKRVGGIKKNRNKKQDSAQKRQNQDELKENKNQKNQNEVPLKFSYLSTKRESKDIPLNFRNSDPRILIQLDENSSPSSSRKCPSNLPSKRIEPEKMKQYQKNYHEPGPSITSIFQRKNRTFEHQRDEIERKNMFKITFLFNKLKLDPTKKVIDKNNLKMRGLNEEQRTQLGSIIAKIYYQNVEYNFDSFSKEFKRMNIECTQNGCLSQQKPQKTKEKSPVKQILPLNSVPKQKEFDQRLFEASLNGFEKEQDLQIPHQVGGTGHRRRNSKLIKKKLFQEIKRISYLEEVTINQLQKNQRITQKDDFKENSSNYQNKKVDMMEKQSRQTEEEIISKDPYIEAPSLYEIQVGRRELVSQRGAGMEKGRLEETLKNGEYSLKGVFSQLAGVNDTCLIQRLNRKLTSYIDKNQIENTFRQFNLNFSELKKHIR